MNKVLKCAALACILLCAANGDPVRVVRVQGYFHGFIALKDTDDRILASGDVIQNPKGNRIVSVMRLHFKDGSLYEESLTFSQRRTFQLLSYKQIEKGPAFKTPQTVTFDASGKLNVQYTDKGKENTISDHLSLPPDLANGMVPMLLTEISSTNETTLSMLVCTPKPRLVKLKISASGQDSYSIAGAAGKATQFVVNIDIGGVTGAVAKVVGKQPPPTHIWVAAGDAPAFLKSEGPLYEDGPIWRIELASPTWPKASQKP
jgi:hypothetical protein